ncbi:OpgC domain-containing protein [Colwelliaceae bacterium MEBiC 14330]
MSRVIAFDGIRGWLLIIIACNHLYGNYVSQFTREPFGFVSAAEGFVFLSGFVAYWVYSNIDDKAKQRQKIWRRTRTLYFFHVGALLLTYLCLFLWPVFKAQWLNYYAVSNWYKDPLTSIFLVISLLEQPGYFDILLLYLLPMCFLPAALALLRQDKVFTLGFLSFMVWVLSHFLNQTLFNGYFVKIFPQLTLHLSYFDPLAWQWLFYLGVIGAYLSKTKQLKFSHSLVLKSSLIGCFIVLFFIKHSQPIWFITFAQQANMPWLLGGNGAVPLLRQINLLLLVYIVVLTWRTLQPFYTLKYPVFLGKHALPVFSFHCMAIYYLGPWLNPWVTSFWLWDVIACLGFVILLSLPAYLDFAYQRANKRAQLKASASVYADRLIE